MIFCDCFPTGVYHDVPQPPLTPRASRKPGPARGWDDVNRPSLQEVEQAVICGLVHDQIRDHCLFRNLAPIDPNHVAMC